MGTAYIYSSRPKPKRAKSRVVCGRPGETVFEYRQRLAASGKRMSALEAENERLRAENADLRRVIGGAVRPEYAVAMHRSVASPIHRANSKAAGRRLVLEAQAQEDLLVAANVALAELARLDSLSPGRKCRPPGGPAPRRPPTSVRPAAYQGLRNALWHLDALDG